MATRCVVLLSLSYCCAGGRAMGADVSGLPLLGFHRVSDFTPPAGFRSSVGEQGACLLLMAEPLMRIYKGLKHCKRFTSFGTGVICDGDAATTLFVDTAACCSRHDTFAHHAPWAGNARCIATTRPVLREIKMKLNGAFKECVDGDDSGMARCDDAERSVVKTFRALVGAARGLYDDDPVDLSARARGFLGQFMLDSGYPGYKTTASELLSDVQTMCSSEGDCRDKLVEHVATLAKRYGMFSLNNKRLGVPVSKGKRQTLHGTAAIAGPRFHARLITPASTAKNIYEVVQAWPNCDKEPNAAAAVPVVESGRLAPVLLMLTYLTHDALTCTVWQDSKANEPCYTSAVSRLLLSLGGSCRLRNAGKQCSSARAEKDFLPRSCLRPACVAATHVVKHGIAAVASAYTMCKLGQTRACKRLARALWRLRGAVATAMSRLVGATAPCYHFSFMTLYETREAQNRWIDTWVFHDSHHVVNCALHPEKCR